MHVVDYEVFPVPPRWCLLRLETSDGTVGWGEPIVEGRSKTVTAAVEELLDDYVVGADPGRIEDRWQTMYRGGFYRGGPILSSAIAGIDQALWDIKGKHLGVSVYELLGGAVRDRVRVYQWVGGDRPADVADDAREAVEAGFTALKMNATAELRRVDAPARVDFHGRVAKPMAKRLAAALEPHDPFFLEEPVLPEHNDFLPALAAHTTTPIATGERVYTRGEFSELLADGAVDVVQPDLSHAGGITECKKIADMAAAHDVALAPHCPLGPIALAACLQVDACSPNALVQEQSLDIHYNEGTDVRSYLADESVFAFEDGFVDLPTDPGLGVDVDEAVVRDRAGDVDWHNPVWRHEDGSLAEW